MRGDRYAEFGLTEADEPFRRAVRDGFKNSGLTHQQFLEALSWYRDSVHPGADATALSANFHDFATSKGWNATHIVAAQGVYNTIQEQGPAALTDAPTPGRDKETIEYATKLLQTEPDRYWADAELQELQLEAIERQQGAPQAPAAAVDHYQIERQIAQRDIAKFEAMMRDPQEAQKYWRSPELQAQFRDAITRSTQEAPVIEQPAPVSTPTEPGPAAPTPAEPRSDAV
jgi:hypothetical protein